MIIDLIQSQSRHDYRNYNHSISIRDRGDISLRSRDTSDHRFMIKSIDQIRVNNGPFSVTVSRIYGLPISSLATIVNPKPEHRDSRKTLIVCSLPTTSRRGERN